MGDFTDELILPQIVLPGDETERRELRDKALYNAILAHGDVNMFFHELSAVEEVLKTAEVFYSWVCQEPEHVSRSRWEAMQIEKDRLWGTVDEANQLREPVDKTQFDEGFGSSL